MSFSCNFVSSTNFKCFHDPSAMPVLRCLIFCRFPGCFGGFPRAALRFFLPAELWRFPVLPKHFLMYHAPFLATVTPSTCCDALCVAAKKQASKQWIYEFDWRYKGFSQRMMKAEVVFRSKFCWVPMRTPRAIWSARAPGGSLWVASVSSCPARGYKESLLIVLFYKDMDVSKNRGKTPKMDG